MALTATLGFELFWTDYRNESREDLGRYLGQIYLSFE